MHQTKKGNHVWADSGPRGAQSRVQGTTSNGTPPPQSSDIARMPAGRAKDPCEKVRLCPSLTVKKITVRKC